MIRYRVYGFVECPWCDKAKALLAASGLPFDFVEIATREERMAWLDARRFKAPNRTFPRVYVIDGETETLIGGFGDLELDLSFAEIAA